MVSHFQERAPAATCRSSLSIAFLRCSIRVVRSVFWPMLFATVVAVLIGVYHDFVQVRRCNAAFLVVTFCCSVRTPPYLGAHTQLGIT